MRKAAALAVTALVALGAALPAARATIGYTPVPLHVGAQFTARAHVARTDYDGTFHEAFGRVGLLNEASHARHVRCRVIVTWEAMHGTARLKGDDHFRVRVGAETRRRIPYRVHAKDEIHRFENIPIRAEAHCHVIPRGRH
jgi:hypothetical protein